MKRGRKSKFDELQIKQRFAELKDPYFKALLKFLNSKEKVDKRFAIEQLSKAFVRMIPEEFDGSINATLKWETKSSPSPIVHETGQ